MKILEGWVDWMEGRANRPRLILRVDEDLPPLKDLRFEQRGRYYFAQHDGFCRFFSWGEGSNNGGFGGNLYEVTMHDGRKVTLQGPWSSSATTMNEQGFGPCFDVQYAVDEAAYKRGGNRAGAVLLATLQAAFPLIDVGRGYTWRPGSPYAAGVVFPVGSSFALAACGTVTIEGNRGRSRVNDFVALPDTFPDGMTVWKLRQAILAAQAANDYDLAHVIADRYGTSYRRVRARELFLSLSGFEPAVKLADGQFWTKPD